MEFDEAVSAAPRVTHQVGAALAAAQGGQVLVVSRGEHCLLTVVASGASAHSVAVLVRHGSGLIFAAVAHERLGELGVPRMSTLGAGESHFYVAIDASAGITTGISATDRARTLQLLADPAAEASWFTRPGHVVPIGVDLNSVGVSDDASAAMAVAVLCRAPVPSSGFCALVSQANPCELADALEGREIATALGLPFVAASDLLTALYADSGALDAAMSAQSR